MAGLLLLLLWLLVGVGSGSSSHMTITNAKPVEAFTVNGHAVPATAAGPTIRQGDVVHFLAPVSRLTVHRLECRGDVHQVGLTRSTWRVPDLPSGAYVLIGPRFEFLVHATGHEAPCPTP